MKQAALAQPKKVASQARRLVPRQAAAPSQGLNGSSSKPDCACGGGCPACATKDAASQLSANPANTTGPASTSTPTCGPGTPFLEHCSVFLGPRTSGEAISAYIYFKTDEYTLDPAGGDHAALDQTADMLRGLGGPAIVSIEGHADKRTSSMDNQNLSDFRAEEVKNYLEGKLSGQSIGFSATGFGATKAHESGSEEALGYDRVVEIKVGTCIPSLDDFTITENSPIQAGMTSTDGTSKCELAYGKDNGAAAGVTFTATITTPSGCKGTFYLLQFIDFCRQRGGGSSGVSAIHTSSDGHYYLDKEDPYIKNTITGTGAQQTITTTDTPGLPTDGMPFLKTRDRFEMYALWEPEVPAAVGRIPLGMLEWSWEASAKRIGGTCDYRVMSANSMLPSTFKLLPPDPSLIPLPAPLFNGKNPFTSGSC